LEDQLYGKFEEVDWSKEDTTEIVLPKGPAAPGEEGFDEKLYGLRATLD
jgi:hypothetical protein